MFERFTYTARRVVVLAQEEARRLAHNYIGTEHMLLGLVRLDEEAGRMLASLDLSLDAARQQVEQIIGRGHKPPSGHIPFTPRAKTVLKLSLDEAEQLGQGNDVSTGHVLLGILREGQGVAVHVLDRLGAEPERVRQQVFEAGREAGL